MKHVQSLTVKFLLAVPSLPSVDAFQGVYPPPAFLLFVILLFFAVTDWTITNGL